MFGPGASRLLPAVAARLGAKRVLLITDPVLVSLGIIEPTLESARAAGLELKVYDGGAVEPSLEKVVVAAEAAAEWRPDLLVGVGGGSNLDLAKLTCVVYSHGGDPAQYLGCDKVPGPLKPLVCVPTTAGTGSEVSHSAVVFDDRRGAKTSALSPYLRPAVALVDPELSQKCPPKLTAESGIDALTHAIEAYLATSFSAFEEPATGFLPYEGNQPIGDLFAERAIRSVALSLIAAVETPSSLEARSGMALAASLAGIAFSQCGVGLAHALEYPIGKAYGCTHGVGNAIVLPHVMRFLEPVHEKRLGRIAAWLDRSGRHAFHGPEAAIAEVERLRDAVGLPRRLRDVGAQREDMPKLAAAAIELTRLIDLTARRPTEADLLSLLEAAY